MRKCGDGVEMAMEGCGGHGGDRSARLGQGGVHAGPEGPRRRLTIREIAQKVGASKSAVSLVLNGRPGVGDELRQRILAVTNEVGWRPNAHARALSSARAHTIGLVLARAPEVLAEDPFFPRFVAGAEMSLSGLGYTLTLGVVGNEPEAEHAVYRRMAQAGAVDGVFLLDLRPQDARCRLVPELGLPALVIGWPLGPIPLPWLAPDESEVVAEAVRLLAQLGHTLIGHVSGDPRFVHAHARKQLWAQSAQALGLPNGPSAPGYFTLAGGNAATRQLLAQTPRPTAIFYANDLMAIGGMTAASEAGLRVPEDLSIVGFDDGPLAGHLLPPLTTVNLSVTEWGELATTALIGLVEGLPWRPPALPVPRFVVRASTGPVPRAPRPAPGGYRS